MSRGDELRAQAEAADREDELAAAYEEALTNYRGRPDDETARDAFKAAAVTLAQFRTAMREEEQRDGVSIRGDAVRDEE